MNPPSTRILVLKPLGGGTMKMALIVENPDAAFAKAIAAGAHAAVPVSEERSWHLGRVIDPLLGDRARSRRQLTIKARLIRGWLFDVIDFTHVERPCCRR